MPKTKFFGTNLRLSSNQVKASAQMGPSLDEKVKDYKERQKVLNLFTIITVTLVDLR